MRTHYLPHTIACNNLKDCRSNYATPRYISKGYGRHNVHSQEAICLIYFADIVMFSRTAEKPFKRTGMVFRLLKDADVTPNLRKCASQTELMT